MGFSNLIFLWTAIIPLTVLIYYFFRKKYKDTPVSSTMFWEEIMQETKVSPYLKHLQRNLLFYLQMLALILFVIALINPYIKTKEIAGGQVIWIVDTSATMLAGKDKSTFDKHREEMLSMVNDISGKPVTIITTGDEPKTILQQETNKKTIANAIEDLEVTYEKEQLSKAIDMANTIIGNVPTTVYLFSDSVENNELPIENEQVEWIVKGAKGKLENISLKRFAATRADNKVLALVQIANESENDQTINLSIYNDEEEHFIDEQVEVKAQDEVSITYENLPLTTKLTASIDVKDDYDIDNKEVALINNPNSEIIIDQQMHRLVQKGFQSVSKNVKIVPSDQLESIGKQALIVTNKVDMLSKSKSPIVLIGRDDEKAKEVNNLVNISKDNLFAFSPLEEVYVSSIYPGFKQFTTIATIGDKPFIQRSARGDIVILADIESTDWPLHPTFPLFLWSLQNELVEGESSLGIFTPNETRAVSLVEGDWSIYSENDEYIQGLKSGSEFKAPVKPGYYIVRQNSDEKQFIVQLESEEKEIKEGKDFKIGSIKNTEQEKDSNQSLIPYIVFVILLVMLLEWEVQRRRGLSN